MPPDTTNTRGLAVLLGGMATDHLALLDYLAGTFAAAMPSATRVQRRGLFNRGRAESVRVHLGDTVFELRDHAGQVEPSIGSSVGGVALSARRSPSMPGWSASQLRSTTPPARPITSAPRWRTSSDPPTRTTHPPAGPRARP